MIKVYTDGSCRGNGYEASRGGWAFVAIDENNEIICSNSGGESETTNNRMEMSALLAACRKFSEHTESVEINMDSAYCFNCFTQKWHENWQKNGWVNARKEPVKNKDLWEEIIPFFENPNYTFRKVKGHADDEWNNYVDNLAVTAAMEV